MTVEELSRSSVSVPTKSLVFVHDKGESSGTRHTRTAYGVTLDEFHKVHP